MALVWSRFARKFMKMASKAGRRGVKRKAAEVQGEETPLEVKGNTGGEDVQPEDGRRRVVIEHCKSCRVYGRNALEVKSALVAARPDITVVLNPLKPRRKSFEITWMDGDKEKTLWTGIKKGPPGKLKFPEASVVVAALEEALKSE